VGGVRVALAGGADRGAVLDEPLGRRDDRQLQGLGAARGQRPDGPRARGGVVAAARGVGGRKDEPFREHVGDGDGGGGARPVVGDGDEKDGFLLAEHLALVHVFLNGEVGGGGVLRRGRHREQQGEAEGGENERQSGHERGRRAGEDAQARGRTTALVPDRD